MIKFSSKKLKRRGNVYRLDGDGDEQFIVLVGNEKCEGDIENYKMQAYCMMTSPAKGPIILEQTRGSIPAFNVLVTINRALTKWHNTNGGPKKEELDGITRTRIKTIMKFAKLMGIEDLVADRTEFEAHFG